MSRSSPSQPLDRSPDEQAAWWCQRLETGEMGAADHAALDAWLAADSGNAGLLAEAQLIWSGAGDVAETPEVLRFRSEAVDAMRRANARRWGRSIDWRSWSALAACLVLAIAMFAYLTHDPASAYRTDVGERRVVLLEDGTRVTLDGATEVRVRMDDASRRLELVSGRAKFDVAHDAMRPLSVLARNRLTVATGTSFSVELLPSQVRVVLYQGRVEVLDRSNEATSAQPGRRAGTELSPGRQLIASTATSAVRTAPLDLAQSLTWESGMVQFDAEPLALAVVRMNRDARVPLTIAEPQLGRLAISGAFNSRDTAAFVEGLTSVYPVTAEEKDGKIVLRGKAIGR